MMIKDTFALIARFIARRTGLLLTLLFGVVAYLTYCAYAPTFDFGFVFDDYPTIINNFYLKLDSYRSFLFAHSRWVSMLWNSFTYHNFGLAPRVLRSQNIVLHLINAGMIFLLFRNLLQGLRSDLFVARNANWIALLTAALFLLHPAQTQTATYITQTRLEGLAVFFILIIVGLFVIGVRATSLSVQLGCFTGASLVAACSAGTKEIVVVLPILMALIDLFFLAQGNWRELFSRWYAYVGVAAALCIAFYMFSFSSTVPFSLSNIVKLDAALDNNRGNLLTNSYTEKITALRYLVSEFRVMVHYIKIYFIPTGLSFDYEWQLAASFWQPSVILSFLFLVLFFAIGLVLWVKDCALPISFGIFWFFISVLPRASIVPSAEMACDYKTHLGSVGMMLLLAYLIARASAALVQIAQTYFGKKLSEHMTFGTVATFVVLAAYQGTVARNDVWSSPLKFWGDVIRKAPRKSRAYNNYAVALAESGATEESLEYYKKSCECDPNYAEPLINLGSHYQMKGDDDKALYYYGQALNLTHEPHPECYNNVGLIQYQHKNYDKAKSCFKTAIALRGHYGKARYNLAKVYYDENNLQAAYEESSLAIRSDFPMPHVFLLYGKCAAKLGKFREAISSLQQALSAGYDFEGNFLLGSAYYNEHDYQNACAQFERVYAAVPNDHTCAYNYAQALMNAGRYSAAMPIFATCKGDPQFPFTQLHIAKCLNETGDKKAALTAINAISNSKLPDFVKHDAALLQREVTKH